ncbi:MAG: MoxR family ATPase [Pyrinomonadaceae bacterium]
MEGTYPLPEAQLDRFMFNIKIGYLPEEDEVAVVKATTTPQKYEFKQIMSASEILAYQDLVRKVPSSETVTRYAVRLVRASRPGDASAPDFINRWGDVGRVASSVAVFDSRGKSQSNSSGALQCLLRRYQGLAPAVLRHRILLNFQAEAEKVDSDQAVKRLIESVPEPKSGLS